MTDSAASAAQPSLSPFARMFDLAVGYWKSRAIAVAAELEIADHLADGPLHVDELARRTKTHAPSLYRLLRALEGIGVFKQESPRVFGNTPMSEFLRRRVAGSFWAAVRDSVSVGSGEFEAWTGLLGSVQTGTIAFDRIYGCNFWEFLKRDPARAEIFNECMRSITSQWTPAVTPAYDWSRFPLIADIGGGIGTQLVDILNAHPTCRGILFDQADVIQQAISHERVERVAGSFFERAPQADAYILRQVIHDWDDERAAEILKTVRAAAKPASRVIVIERVIPESVEDSFGKWMDLHMLVVSGGRERTAAEFRALLGQAGFEMEQIIPTPAGISLVVARPS